MHFQHIPNRCEIAVADISLQAIVRFMGNRSQRAIEDVSVEQVSLARRNERCFALTVGKKFHITLKVNVVASEDEPRQIDLEGGIVHKASELGPDGRFMREIFLDGRGDLAAYEEVDRIFSRAMNMIYIQEIPAHLRVLHSLADPGNDQTRLIPSSGLRSR